MSHPPAAAGFPDPATADLAEALREPALVAAPRLLGAILRNGPVAVAITEVEAYEGESDPASHAYRGPTARNAVMFGPSGFLYVYVLHGHHCCNVVCGPPGPASALLVRAGRVVDGLEIARERRPRVADVRLARGPGCLTRALGITRTEHGAGLFDPKASLQLTAGSPPTEVATGPRVGVSRAAERPWRFWIAGDPTVSAYRRAARFGTQGDSQAQE